jgi:DNA replication and repair protein RecF
LFFFSVIIIVLFIFWLKVLYHTRWLLRRKITEILSHTEIYFKLFSFFVLKAVFLQKNRSMILNKLSILNYKNIREGELLLSPKFNCFIGHNGVGKTNILDAIYFLSFCHSANTNQDSQTILHDAPFFVLEGNYQEEDGQMLNIYCGMKRGTKKHFKRDQKEYKRLSEHIGLIPLVLVAPADMQLIEGNSEERRRLMDMVISQLDRTYLDTLNRYNKALQQRNSMLKDEDVEPDPEILSILEEQMAMEGEAIFKKRNEFVSRLTPLFQHFYETISGGHEQVSLEYISHCQRGPLLQIIQRDRMKDRAVGYSLHGIHRDDLEIMLNGHPMRREGSQGQQKTFVIALKLAQYESLKQAHGRTMPLLLLDDIFDKLDATRVEKIVQLVAEPGFGQIFITDTNRDHLDQILQQGHFDHQLFYVDDGHIEQQ